MKKTTKFCLLLALLCFSISLFFIAYYWGYLQAAIDNNITAVEPYFALLAGTPTLLLSAFFVFIAYKIQHNSKGKNKD